MPSFRVSPPFTLTADDWAKIGKGALLAGLGGVGAYLSAKAIPTLQEHVANDYGALIVALAATALPIVGNIIRKFFGESTSVAGAVLFCLMLAPAGASADEIAVLLPDAPKSYIVTVDAQGVATVFPLKSVSRPGPQPTPPAPPGPVVLTDRGKAMRDVAMKVTGDLDRNGTAQGLAELYRQIKKLIADGTIKDLPSLSLALRTGADNFLASRGPAAPQAWQPVRDHLSKEITTLQVRQPPAQFSEYGVLLGEVAEGLDASAPQRALDPQVLALILQIIQMIIALLQPH